MKRLAEAVLLAADIREKSFDQDAADTLEKSDLLIKDFNDCYIKSLSQACDEAAEKVGFGQIDTQPIYLLLRYTWNDILDWAKERL